MKEAQPMKLTLEQMYVVKAALAIAATEHVDAAARRAADKLYIEVQQQCWKHEADNARRPHN